MQGGNLQLWGCVHWNGLFSKQAMFFPSWCICTCCFLFLYLFLASPSYSFFKTRFAGSFFWKDAPDADSQSSRSTCYLKHPRSLSDTPSCFLCAWLMTVH